MFLYGSRWNTRGKKEESDIKLSCVKFNHSPGKTTHGYVILWPVESDCDCDRGSISTNSGWLCLGWIILFQNTAAFHLTCQC